MRKCIACKEFKEDSMFRKQSAAKDGLKPYCKPCDSQKAKEAYQKNRERRLAQIAEWRKNNPEKVFTYGKNMNSPKYALPELQEPR